MRQEFLDRLRTLIKEKLAGAYRDGWVYGRIKQEFELQTDELGALATALGFKLGWNSAVQEILERQWKEDEAVWMRRELVKTQKQLSLAKQKSNLSHKIATLIQELETSGQPTQDLTDMEQVLIRLILKMNLDEQTWLLETILNRYKV